MHPQLSVADTSHAAQRWRCSGTLFRHWLVQTTQLSGAVEFFMGRQISAWPQEQPQLLFPDKKARLKTVGQAVEIPDERHRTQPTRLGECSVLAADGFPI